MSEKRTSWILKLVDRVTDPIKKIIKNTNGATQAAERLAQKYEKLSQRADHFSGRLTKMAVGVAAFAALTYGSVQFETGMAKANTMAGLGVQQFAALNDQIKDVAGNVPILRDELANGLYETISNGVPEKNWVSFLQDSSKAAVGGLSDIKEVVGVTSTIIKNYGMEWDKAGSIQDKIQNTAKLGKTSFQELGSALPKVTGNAATLGVGLDELLGSFAALTGVSGNTAEVSTQLSAIFTSLVKPTSEATEMAKNMGIQFDSLSIKKAGGVIQFFDQLKTKVTQYSAETGQNSTEIYGKLFSSAEALRAFIPLTSSVSEDFKNKTTQVANSAGVMQSAFETMSATTANKIQLMRNKFGNAMDKIFEATQPFLDLLIVGTTNVLDFVSEFATIYPNATKVAVSIGIAAFATVLFGTVIMFASLKVRMMWIQTQRLGIRLTLLAGRFKVAMVSSWNFAKSMAISAFNAAKMGAAALWTGITAIPSLVIALGTWIAAQTGLNIVMNANPIGVVILAVGALIGVVALVIKYWDNLKGYLISFGKFFLMLNPFGFMLVLIDTIFPQFRGIVSDIFDKVMGYLSNLWGNIKEIFGSIASFLGLDFDTNVNVKTTPDDEPEFSPDGGGFSIDPNSFAANNGSVPENSGGSIDTGTTTSGGIKSITQTITVQQNFTLPTNWKDEIENIRRSMASLISASAADGVAAL